MSDKLAKAETATLATSEGEDTFLSFLERASKDPTFDVAKFEALMAAKERVDAQERKRLYAVDMAGLQAKLAPMIKSGKNEHTHSRFVKLDDMLVTLQPLLDEFGFAVGFDCKPLAGATGWLEFSCTFTHRAGHSETKTLPLPVDGKGAKGGSSGMNDVQAVGSTTTYARRYLLDMHLNIARRGEDNDGSGAEKLVNASQAKAIEDALARSGKEPDRFWRFMSMGQPRAITSADAVPLRDYQRAMAFFQASPGGAK